MKFDTCIVLINASSSHGKGSAKMLDELNAYFSASKQKTYKLEPADFDDSTTVKALLERSKNETLVVVIGGDGTVSYTANLLLQMPPKERSRYVLVPLKAGNASDVAHMLNGRHSKDLTYILEHGEKRTAYAVSLDIDHERSYFVAYVSFGATATTMDKLDGIGRDKSLKKHASVVLMHEVMVGFKALWSSGRFKAALNNKRRQYYYDIMFINGSRIAKLYKTPARLTRPTYMRIVLKHKHPVLLQHLVSWVSLHVLRHQHHAQTTLTFSGNNIAQIDGEVRNLPKDSTVVIAKKMEPYKVLSSIS